MKRRLQFVIGLVLAAALVWLILRGLDRAALAQSMTEVDPRSLAFGAVLWAAGYACRIARWRLMLRATNPDVGFWRAAVPFLGSIGANNLLPFRLGDVLRCFGSSRWLAIDAGTVTATVLVERLLDLLTLLMALGLALLVFAPQGGVAGLLGVGAAGITLLGLVCLILLLMPGTLRPLVRLLIGALRKFAPTLADRAAAFADPMMATLATLARGRRMFRLLAWSALAWFFEGAVYYAVARGIPAMAGAEAAWLAMPVGTLATLLPSTPGFVGTFDYFAIAAAQVGGNDRAAATAGLIQQANEVIGGAVVAVLDHRFHAHAVVGSVA